MEGRSRASVSGRHTYLWYSRCSGDYLLTRRNIHPIQTELFMHGEGNCLTENKKQQHCSTFQSVNHGANITRKSLHLHVYFYSRGFFSKYISSQPLAAISSIECDAGLTQSHPISLHLASSFSFCHHLLPPPQFCLHRFVRVCVFSVNRSDGYTSQCSFSPPEKTHLVQSHTVFTNTLPPPPNTTYYVSVVP